MQHHLEHIDDTRCAYLVGSAVGKTFSSSNHNFLERYAIKVWAILIGINRLYLQIIVVSMTVFDYIMISSNEFCILISYLGLTTYTRLTPSWMAVVVH